MRGALLSFGKEITIISNTFVSSVVLATYYFYMQPSGKFGSLRKFSGTRENIHMPAVSVDIMFSKTTQHHSKTICAHVCILFYLYTFIGFEEQKTSCFCVFISYVRAHIVYFLTVTSCEGATRWCYGATTSIDSTSIPAH